MDNYIEISKLQLDKKFYKIGEVAKILGLEKTSTLRYWEKEFPEIKASKGANGSRQYTQDQITRIVEIYNLLKVNRFTINGARKELAANRNNVVLTKLKYLQAELRNLDKEIDLL